MMRLSLGVAALWMVELALAQMAAAGSAERDPFIGVWQTAPDRKDLVSHIEVTACGAALCGRVLAAFDAAGAEVRTKHVGKRLFWDLKPLGDGVYGDGMVYVPLLDVTAQAKARLSGNQATVTGCKGPVCRDLVWTRLR